MRGPLSGKVSLKAVKIGHPIESTQKGSRYVHSAIFDGVLEQNGGLEARFIFPRFRDDSLGVFRLPINGLDNGTGYVDFSSVHFGEELFPYKSENRPKEDYNRLCEVLMVGRLQW